MSEQNNGKSSTPSDPQPKRTVGVFPRVPFEKVVELVKVIYELGVGERVRRLDVFDKLQKQPGSGPSRTLVTTGGIYKVITYNSDYLEITSLGERVVTSKNEFEKRKAIYEALFANEIFKALVERYQDKPLPTDTVILDYLKQAHKLSGDDAKACWSVFKENMGDFGLLQEYSGRPAIISGEAALGKLPKPEISFSPIQQEDKKGFEVSIDHNESSTPNVEPRKSQKLSNPLQPQFVFNIQIQLPENASEETYKAIFKNIGTYLLNRNED